MELHRFFRYAIEKMCKEKKSLNHFNVIYVTIVLQNKKDSLKKLCFSSNNSIKTFSDNAKKRYFMLIILRLSSENS